MRGQTNFTVLRYGSWGPQLKLVNKFGNLNSINVSIYEKGKRPGVITRAARRAFMQLGITVFQKAEPTKTHFSGDISF